MVVLAHGHLAHDRHVAAFNRLVVLAQAEGVHVELSVQIRNRSRANGGVFVIAHLQLLYGQLVVLLTLFVQAVERPYGFALECGGIAAAKALVEHLVELELAIVVHGAERLLHLARCGA